MKIRKLTAVVLTVAIGISMLTTTGFAAETAKEPVQAMAVSTLAEKKLIPIDKAHFPDAKFRACLKKEFGNKEGKLDPKQVYSLDISKKGIKSLKGIEYFTDLAYLTCNKNKLTSLNIRKNKKLEYIECERNNLKSLDISKNKRLDAISCQYNKIKKLNTNNNKNLQTLFVYGNKIKTLDLKKNKKIQFVSCDKNVKVKGRKVPNLWREYFSGF